MTSQEKGKWVWTLMHERPQRTHDIFQLERMVMEQGVLGVPWFVACVFTINIEDSSIENEDLQ